MWVDRNVSGEVRHSSSGVRERGFSFGDSSSRLGKASRCCTCRELEDESKNSVVQKEEQKAVGYSYRLGTDVHSSRVQRETAGRMTVDTMLQWTRRVARVEREKKGGRPADDRAPPLYFAAHARALVCTVKATPKSTLVHANRRWTLDNHHAGQADPGFWEPPCNLELCPQSRTPF